MYTMLSQIYRQYFKGSEKGDKQEQDVTTKKTASHEPGLHSALLADKHHKILSEHQFIPIYSVDSSTSQLFQLQQKNTQLQDFVVQSKSRETEFQNVLGDYDELFQKLVAERKTMMMQHADGKKRLENMETAFYDLLKKYEKAKGIIQDFKNNEVILKEELERYKTLVGDVRRGVAASSGHSNKEATYDVIRRK